MLGFFSFFWTDSSANYFFHLDAKILMINAKAIITLYYV